MSSALPSLNMKHYKSVKILSNFQNVKPLAHIQTPIQNFLATILVFKLHISSRDSLLVFDSYQSEKVRNRRIVNLTVTTIWVRRISTIPCNLTLLRRRQQHRQWSWAHQKWFGIFNDRTFRASFSDFRKLKRFPFFVLATMGKEPHKWISIGPRIS